MSNENQKVVKFDVVKVIKTEYNQEILNWLKEKNFKYEVNEIKDLIPYQTKEEIEGKSHFIAIPKDLYKELDNLCKINNWDVDKKIIGILRDAVFSAEITGRHGQKQVSNF